MADETPPPSREDKVTKLAELKAKQTSLQQEYEELRDELVQELDEAQFFLDPVTGEKRVAYRVAPEVTKVNVELLESYVPTEVIESVTERKIKTDAFWQAVKAGRIPDHVAARVTTLIPQTPHVRFGDPSDLARRAAE